MGKQQFHPPWSVKPVGDYEVHSLTASLGIVGVAGAPKKGSETDRAHP